MANPTASTASSVETIDEQTIIDRARHDPREFAPLYDRYASVVFGFCVRRLGDRDAAADATHDVFVKAINSLDGYRGGNVKSWLFSIANSVVIDRSRRDQRYQNAPFESAPEREDGDPTPDTVAIGRDGDDWVRTMLAQLSDEQRIILELRLSGLTAREIAEQLGKSLESVKIAQFRALQKLRRIVDQQNSEAFHGDE